MHVCLSHCSLNWWSSSKCDEHLATSRWPQRTVLKRHSSIISSTEDSFASPLEETFVFLQGANLGVAFSASFAQSGPLVPQSWTTTADSCAISSKARDAAILQILLCEHLQSPVVHYARHSHRNPAQSNYTDEDHEKDWNSVEYPGPGTKTRFARS